MSDRTARYIVTGSVVFQIVLCLIVWFAMIRSVGALSMRIHDFEQARAETPRAIAEIHTMAAQMDSLMQLFYPGPAPEPEP